MLFIKYKQITKTPANDRQQIIAKLQPFINLPDEQPDLSTVLDSTKLTNPILEQRTKNGDILIIYKGAKRLIIYRPSTGKVVDMLSIQERSDAPTN